MLRSRRLAGLLASVSSLAFGALSACGSDDAGRDGITLPGPGGGGGDGGSDAGGAVGGGDVTPSEAGAAGAAPEWGPLELVSRTPDESAANVWFYEPITLELSNPLDESTVTSDVVKVTIDDVAQAASLTLSEDGKTITLRLKTPPVMGATARVEVGEELRDRQGTALVAESWSYRLPLWQEPEELGDSSTTEPVLALDDEQRPLVALLRDGELSVSRLEGAAWVTLGTALNPGGSASGAPALVFDAKLGPVVAYREGSKVHVAAWQDDAWTALGAGIPANADGVALARGTGQLQLALRGAGGIELWSLDGDAFVKQGSVPASASAGGFALALDGKTPLIAYYDDTPGLALVALEGGAFVEAATPLSLQELPTGAPSLFVTNGEAYVAYLDSDDVSWNAFVAVRKAGASTLEPFGAALDLVFNADASAPQVGAGVDGGISLSWLETQSGLSKLYAARSKQGRLQFLGSALETRQTAPESLGLAVDAWGNPNLVYAEGGVSVLRYNGSPRAPFGIAARASSKSCVFPATTAPGFPTTLAATGCYRDVAKHQLMDAALPYELNTALWSDGALKRRFIVLPDGKTIDATDTGAWKLPLGAIIIKEFWYEKVAGDPTSAFPMETRFLVKRCEEEDGCFAPLEGYSYQWNAEGTEATLLTDNESPPGTGLVVKWPVTSGGDAGEPAVHSHTYPSRAQCVRCHNANIGRYLGLQTPQLNRNATFDGAVDNQLRTFEAIGVFSKPLSAGGADAKARLPSSADPSFTLQERALAYFHSNCAHCHNPQGEKPTIDFRYYGGAGLTVDNICDKLIPGDSTNSLIYVRDSLRPGGMPPIATLAPDPRELPITAAWIDGLTACPEQ